MKRPDEEQRFREEREAERRCREPGAARPPRRDLAGRDALRLKLSDRGAAQDDEQPPADQGAGPARWVRCDWHPEHSADDRPTGPRCGAPATHRIVWLDGTDRVSYGCSGHLKLDPEAPPHRIEKLEPLRSAGTGESKQAERSSRPRPRGGRR